MRKTIDVPKDILYQKYIIEKKSIETISKELGFSGSIILKSLIKYCIPRRSTSTKGKHRSLETKKKISEAKKGKPNPKLSEAMKGKHHSKPSATSREKIANSIKKLWEDSNYRRRITESAKKTSSDLWEQEWYRQKVSSASNAYYAKYRRTIICRNCKKEKTVPNHVPDIFCSKSCSTSYRNKINNPTKNPQTIKKIIHSKKGKKYPKMSSSKKRLFESGILVPYNKGKTLIGLHGKEKATWMINRIKLAHVGKKLTKEHRKKLEKNIDEKEILRLYTIEGKNIPEIARNFNVNVSTIMNRLDKHIKRRSQSEISKVLWQDPEYREKTMRAFIKACQIKPNKKEQLIDSMIQSKFPNQYKLNVHGNTILNGRIPDFINCNGQKKVINFNGIYWHLWRLQKKNPELTKEIIEEKERKPYNELGFKVLFIWEDELNDEANVINKIKNFIGDQKDEKIVANSISADGNSSNTGMGS